MALLLPSASVLFFAGSLPGRWAAATSCVRCEERRRSGRAGAGLPSVVNCPGRRASRTRVDSMELRGDPLPQGVADDDLVPRPDAGVFATREVGFAHVQRRATDALERFDVVLTDR